jgi:ring-1,2-phenylacetyl-CoA epoxidase subunit PaaE
MNAKAKEENIIVTIIVDEEIKNIKMSKKETVLEAALRNDIDAPYSCQGGVCSSCVARITEGEVVMMQNQILTENEIAEGLILTCQAHPTTETLGIDYDDV